MRDCLYKSNSKRLSLFFIYVSCIKLFRFLSVAQTERRSIEDDVEYVADSLSFYWYFFLEPP